MTKNNFLKKDTILKLIGDIYKLTDTEEAEFTPCLDCNGVCEDIQTGERVTFLPFEKEHIQDSLSKDGLTISGKSIKSISDNNPSPCPFLTNRCDLHKYRPFDCRSYPLIPSFNEDGSWKILFSKRCPYTGKTSKTFFDIVENSWKIIFPFLTESWKQSYNRKQFYFKEIDKKSNY